MKTKKENTGKPETEAGTFIPISLEENPNPQQSTGDDLFEDFAKFQNNMSSFKPEENSDLKTEQPNTNTNSNEPKKNIVQNVYVANIADKAKLKMFLGFVLFCLAGLNTFILNKIKGTIVPSEKLLMTEPEKDSLMIYLDDPKVYEFINKIPGWMLGIAHMEYMFYLKHSEFAKEYKVEKIESNINLS